MQNDWIITTEYCDKCHIEPVFLELLEENGLITLRTEGGQRYLLVSQLPEVERYSRLYYDLSINMEGIDAIHYLLERVEALQREVGVLRSRLRLYEDGF